MTSNAVEQELLGLERQYWLAMPLDAADASTWVRRDGRWVCALHTESLKGDPFGRDRVVRVSSR